MKQHVLEKLFNDLDVEITEQTLDNFIKILESTIKCTPKCNKYHHYLYGVELYNSYKKGKAIKNCDRQLTLLRNKFSININTMVLKYGPTYRIQYFIDRLNHKFKNSIERFYNIEQAVNSYLREQDCYMLLSRGESSSLLNDLYYHIKCNAHKYDSEYAYSTILKKAYENKSEYNDYLLLLHTNPELMEPLILEKIQESCNHNNKLYNLVLDVSGINNIAPIEIQRKYKHYYNSCVKKACQIVNNMSKIDISMFDKCTK